MKVLRRSHLGPWCLLRRAATCLAVLSSMGCAILAEEPNQPGPLPHGGTGEFLPLSADETGVVGTPAGRAVVVDGAFDSGAVAGGWLFYASAPLRSGAADPPPGSSTGDVDWEAFEPLRISRSAPTDLAGFALGDQVLAATATWEGGAVHGPWPLLEEDGSLLLFYAGASGIGLARAPSMDGVLTKAAEPVLVANGGLPPSRPSVIRGLDGRLHMYFDAGGSIGLATSEDGARFVRVTDALDLGPDPIDDGTREMGVAGPGALRVQTGAGRSVVRLYHESLRDDGTRVLLLAASADGVTFERFEVPVVADGDRRAPCPVVVDSRTTLLYLTAPRLVRDRQVRSLIVTRAPRD